MPDIDDLCINTLRVLSIDAVQHANSGHPGMPMGAAAMAYTLWTRFLRFNPHDPLWPDRDRFVLSAGHGSMLLYSLLHLTGYDLPLDELKRFRQLGSKTPGHPERGYHTPGVEVSTGPLGQGFGNGVGMAIAERWLAARYNRPDHTIVDHYTYGIVSDGDLMEGVAAEAASLAGHLKLGKLIYLYDHNYISLAGATNLTFTEDVAKRFGAYGWHTRAVPDGNDVADVQRAIEEARAEEGRPSLLLVRTHIGFGSPKKQDTFGSHGSPLGEDEVKATKVALGWPTTDIFICRKNPSSISAKQSRKAGSCRKTGNRASRRTQRHSRTKRRNGSAFRAGDCPTAGMPTCPNGSRKTSRSRPAWRPGKRSTRWRNAYRISWAGRPI